MNHDDQVDAIGLALLPLPASQVSPFANIREMELRLLRSLMIPAEVLAGPIISYFDERAGLIARVRWIATEALGERVDRVDVELTDHDSEIRITIKTPEGWRHAVRGRRPRDPDVVGWTLFASLELGVWINARRALALLSALAP